MKYAALALLLSLAAAALADNTVEQPAATPLTSHDGYALLPEPPQPNATIQSRTGAKAPTVDDNAVFSTQLHDALALRGLNASIQIDTTQAGHDQHILAGQQPYYITVACPFRKLMDAWDKETPTYQTHFQPRTATDTSPDGPGRTLPGPRNVSRAVAIALIGNIARIQDGYSPVVVTLWQRKPNRALWDGMYNQVPTRQASDYLAPMLLDGITQAGLITPAPEVTAADTPAPAPTSQPPQAPGPWPQDQQE